MTWSPDSWKRKPAMQQPLYPDAAAAEAVLTELATLPPLVTSWEIESLKAQLAEAAAGHRFLLQGGDCAETFDECESSIIAAKLKILLQMSLVLVHGTQKRVIRVGRFAGQYAKPRTSDTEVRNGQTLPVYRGDIVNRAEFSAAARRPDPRNMIRAHARSAMTLNFIRALIDGGFADLHHPEYWDLDFVRHAPLAAEYQRMVESIGQSLRFMETLAGVRIGQMTRVDFYTSHEALHLAYEQALTRQVPHRSGWYNLSTHFPWIGMRTAHSGGGGDGRGGGAHLEYFRGIANPIAVKIGPSMTPNELLGLLETLHPRNEPGRMTLIHRFGAHEIARCLPPLIQAVKKSGKTVLWCCDPMHGNTQSVEIRHGGTEARRHEVIASRGVAAGNVSLESRADSVSTNDPHTTLTVKTRKFEHILAELEQAFEIHAAHGTYLGGVHFELTGDNVTECTGGARGLSDADLQRAYRSQVDPRLNYEQSLEMAMLIARRVAAMNENAK